MTGQDGKAFFFSTSPTPGAYQVTVSLGDATAGHPNGDIHECHSLKSKSEIPNPVINSRSQIGGGFLPLSE
jgi:hypothetical protein